MNINFPKSLCLVFLFALFVSEAFASPVIMSAWDTRYSSSNSSVAAGCQLCHQGVSGGNGWNAYGWAVRSEFLANGKNADAAFISVESLDSDMDPTASSNLTEINADTQPGWTTGAVNTIYFKDGSTLINQLAPSVGTLDPIIITDPDIAVTPGNLDFGTVVIGAQVNLDVDIQNLGNADLLVSSVVLCSGTSSEFSFNPLLSPTIAAGENEILSVFFTPIDEGLDAGCLDINSNDPDQPTVNVSLNGEGFTPTGNLLDVDIDAFDVTADVQLGGSPVAISLDIRNNSNVDSAADAMVIGSQNGSEVYSETLGYLTGPSSTLQTLNFPDYTPTISGEISWTASLLDEDPDIDEASATTNVASLAIADPIPAEIRTGSIRITLEPVATGLVAPNYGISAPGLSDNLFVVDQPGKVWNVDLFTGDKTVFLDVSSQLVPLGIFGAGSFDERGLLGIAFHPDYATNGLVYTYTSEPVDTGIADFSTMPADTIADHHSVISEWQVTAPDNPLSVVEPGSERELLRIDQPQFNHDGGTVAFGPDGLLYISVGDGGGADDHDGQPFIEGDVIGHGEIGNGRDATNPLGTILRIDPAGDNSANGNYGIPLDNPFVDPDDPRLAEIYAYGFRNPFRFSFDTRTGELYAADVGQNDVEEVDLVINGGNYGWNHKEGSFIFDANGTNDGFVTNEVPDDLPADLIDPILEYDHDEGISITGGFVYRGTSIRPLGGRYVFGDWSGDFSLPSGRLFYRLGRSGIREFSFADRESLGYFLHGFGQDADGELYVMANLTGTPFDKEGEDTGVVLRITLAPRGMP